MLQDRRTGQHVLGGISEDSKVGTIESRRRALEARGCFLRAIFRPGEEKGRRRDRQMVSTDVGQKARFFIKKDVLRY